MKTEPFPTREVDMPRHTRAFTLIELLVVIAIIAIIAAMLMPALAKAKDQARKIKCIGNHKQLAVAWALYPIDNQELLVMNGGAALTFTPGSTPPYLWAYGGNHGDPGTLTNKSFLVDSRYALLASYARAHELYKCPADRVQWPLSSGKVYELRSYTLNSYIGTPSSPSLFMNPLTYNSNYELYLKSSQLNAALPADRFLFIDGNPQSICTPGFGVDLSADAFLHFPSTFHNMRAGVSFADGHVEAHKWLDGRTKSSLPVTVTTYLSHFTPSVGNVDVRWLQAHATRRK